MTEENQETKEEPTDLPEPKTRDDISEIKMSRELARLKQEREELVNKLKQKEVQELKAKEDWQSIASQYEQEANDYKKRYSELRENLILDKKLSDLKTKALTYNIRKEAIDDLEMLDLSELQVETTNTGRLNVLGTESVLSRLKIQKPHWFNSQKSNLNTEHPSLNSDSKLTLKDLREAEVKAKSSRDYSDYNKKVLQFKNQNKK
jgi:hypothetical protein